MPPDVFLALASSGITLVASLLFFVSDGRPPPNDDERFQVAFCLPPLRPRAPPPLPEAVRVETAHGTMYLRPEGDTWAVSFESSEWQDAPVHGAHVSGHIDDLRWHGQARVTKAGAPARWKQRPGKA